MSKILIIEDEESIANLEKDYLEISGFEVDIETDGRAGLAAALTKEYDLYILDLMLPGMDGLTFAERSARERIRRSCWCPPRKMISTRFAVSAWVRMIISQSRSHRASWSRA